MGLLGFKLVEDTVVAAQDKRWVVIAPAGSSESGLLLARAADPEQAARIGNQTGGRVFLFLYTDDFWRDYTAYKAKGVEFVRDPKQESYGMVAVFERSLREFVGSIAAGERLKVPQGEPGRVAASAFDRAQVRA